MAIAKPAFHAPVVKPEVSQPKRGRSLLCLAHHGASIDLSRAPSPSRQPKHKHNHKHSNQHHPEHHQKRQKHPGHRHTDKKTHKSTSSSSVYDRCLDEAMRLKARILIEHPDRVSRFRLSLMKRVVIPPVTIPKPIAQRRGARDLVAGKNVPFTRAMWETGKQTHDQAHMLPVIPEIHRLRM
ncbi:hypothetical protein BBJ28_00002944 [Nothophytophthora sp. Chile5]|nr:hypothetical protein BBJ28_00002944 [Nothophytophthora sp. Chile5]